MHFLPCSLFSLLLNSFFFFFVISLSILFVSYLSRYPPFIYGYCSYLYQVNPIGFFHFTHIAPQPFLSAVSTPSELPTSPMASRPLLHLGMPNAFSIFYYLFHDNFLSVWFCREFISLILMGKALGFFLPISIACIKWSQPFNTYFGQRCILSGASPKRGLGWVPEINHFPTYNKLHPLQIL